MSNVFTSPADLVSAIAQTARMDQAIVAPSMGEHLRTLVAPGRVIAFRTESGSLYEASIYTTLLTVRGHEGHRVQLHKIVDDRPVLAAEGIAHAARDHDRGVWGLIVDEPSGRYVKTSAIKEAWISYDATTHPSMQPAVEAAPVEPSYGMCLSCGAVEVALNKATDTRNLSSIGESAEYPTGRGCELCD